MALETAITHAGISESASFMNLPLSGMASNFKLIKPSSAIENQTRA